MKEEKKDGRFNTFMEIQTKIVEIENGEDCT